MKHSDGHRAEFTATSPEHQPSIWGQARPPALIPENRHIEVYLGDTRIARSQKVVRVIGSGGGPVTFYVPRKDVCTTYLHNEDQSGHCKWRGKAEYFTIDTGARAAQHAACHYANPTNEFSVIADHVCFHPARVACYLDGERVWSQQQDKNGSWITSEYVGSNSVLTPTEDS